jgi:hypothetical protein
MAPMPTAVLMLPCTMNELAELCVRSAISSAFKDAAPAVAVAIDAASADWLTPMRWNAGRAAAALGAPPPRLASSALSVRNFISHCGDGAPGVTPTSRVIVSNPNMRISNVHTPSASSAKRNAPRSSVVVATRVSPSVAVTVAPGSGSPATWMVPWYSAAMSVAVNSSPMRARFRVANMIF